MKLLTIVLVASIGVGQAVVANAESDPRVVERMNDRQVKPGLDNRISAKGPVTIIECNAVLSEPGRYALHRDLACDGAPVVINADDVSLNLRGYAVSCTDEDLEPLTGAILVVGAAGVKIFNGSVTGCWNGIFFSEVAESRVSRVVATSNVYGIAMSASHQNVVRNNDVSGNIIGMELGQSTTNEIVDNVISGNQVDGLELITSDFNKILRNQVNRNGDTGMWIIGAPPDEEGGLSEGNIIRGNSVNDNGRVGIHIAAFQPIGIEMSTDNVVHMNTAYGNGHDPDFGMADLAEFNYIEVAEECFNIWKQNDFGSEVGPPSCIQ